MQHTQPDPDELDAQREIRQRLLQRLAIAVSLIVIVSIAIWALNRLEEPVKHVPEASTINPIQPLNQSDIAKLAETEPTKPDSKATETTPDNKQADAPSTANAETDRAAKTATSGDDKKTESVSAPSTNTISRAAAEPSKKSTASEPDDEPVSVAPAKSAPLTGTPRPTSSAPAPVISAAPSPIPLATPKPVKAPPATAEQTITGLATGILPVGSRGFNLQAGVFQSNENAEKLLQRLRTAGIPAHIETRIQVGPFKNKEDAQRMSVRLKELGINPLIQPPGQ